MTIPFNKIPSNLRVPLLHVELDPSRANTASDVQRTLIIGQKTSVGTAVANVPVQSQGVAEARTAGGPGSQLAAMTATYRFNDPAGEVWYLPLSDDGSGTAATGSIAFTGPTTAAGTLYLYIGGQLVQVGLSAAMTAAQVATVVIAAITAATDVTVTAVVNGAIASQVDLTAKNKGLAGNDTDIRLNYYGAIGGEVTPAGLTVTIVAMSGGATNPTLTTALANLVDKPFDFIVHPYNDATSLAALAALLNDTTGRWSWANQVYGHAFYGFKGTSGALTTFGLTQNDPHASCIGVYDSPTPVWRWAAAVAGAAAVSLRIDPGVPLQTLQVLGVLAPSPEKRFGMTIRNTLLFSGISTFTVNAGGGVAIENLITTYQTNAQSQPDDSYLQVETLFLLAFVLRSLNAFVVENYGRSKLASVGTRPRAGSRVANTNTIRAGLIGHYRGLEDRGYVQQSDVFAANLVVEKPGTPNRINVLWAGILIEQVRIFALLAQFRNA
ncbi:MAG: phage tail sheath family protein [Frankiales bacterium]|nr:phage tail sheath family protein [Frankiales bacterium]